MPPLAAIERIEVVRGPMSSLYGSDAMGGVINMITRQVGKSWHTSVRSEAVWQEDRRSGDIYQSSLYTSGPLIDGLLGVKLNGLLSHRSEDRIVEGYNAQRMKSSGVTFTLTPDEANSIDLDLGHFVQDRNSSPGQSVSASSDPSDVRYTRNNYALTHHGNYDGGMTTSYLQREETRNPSRDMKTANTLMNTQNTLYLGDHTVSVGGQYRYETLNDKGNQLSSARSLSELNRWSWALFAEDEWLMTQDFALTTGLRMDRDENYGSHWTPRLYGVWHLTETWTLKGGISGGYRSPDLRQVVADWGQITGGGVPAIIIGNPDLKPEKSLNQEIALLWDNHRFLSTGVTVFNTDYRDKITEVRSCTDPSGTNAGACKIGDNAYKFISNRVNVDKARVRGVEATMNWTLSPAWSRVSSYTFTETEQRSGEFSGKPLNEMPKHMINATLNWQTTPDIASWLRVNHRCQSSAYLGRTSMSEGRPSIPLSIWAPAGGCRNSCNCRPGFIICWINVSIMSLTVGCWTADAICWGPISIFDRHDRARTPRLPSCIGARRRRRMLAGRARRSMVVNGCWVRVNEEGDGRRPSDLCIRGDPLSLRRSGPVVIAPPPGGQAPSLLSQGRSSPASASGAAPSFCAGRGQSSSGFSIRGNVIPPDRGC